MSTFIQLGTSGSFIAPASGQLILQCYDGYTSDNSGFLPVTINGVVYNVQASGSTNGPLLVAGQSYAYSCPATDYWSVESGPVTVNGVVYNPANANFNADGIPAANNDAPYRASDGYPLINPQNLTIFSLVGEITETTSIIVPLWTGSEYEANSVVLTGTFDTTGQQIVSFNLYSAPSANGPWELLTSANEPDFDVSYPEAEVPTYYRFTAVNSQGGESVPSAPILIEPSQEDEEDDMERATIFQGLTLAAESSLGVLAANPKVFLLPSVITEVKPMQQNKTFPGRGVKGKIAKQRAKEYSQFTMSGPLGYDELVFLMQSHLATSAPAAVNASTTAAQWNTLATSAKKDTPTTFTVQVGSAEDGATQASGCFVTDFSVKVTDTEATFTATMVGMILVDSINYTGQYPYLPAATEIVTYPVHESGIGIYYGTNLAAMTPLSHLIEFSYDSKNRWKPAFFRDPTKPSYSGIVEGAFDGTGKLTVEEDSNANVLLALTRTDNPIGQQSQTYIAMQAGGVVIDAANTADYGLTFEWPVLLVKSPSRSDKNDVYSGEYDFEVANDPTIGCMTANITSQVLALH